MATTSGYKIPENLKARLKDSYDAIAPKYNEWTIPRSANRIVYLDKLMEIMSGTPNASILELGAGAGVPVLKKLLTYPNLSLTANDLSDTQIELGKKDFGEERIKWVQGDMLSLSFPDAKFDAVLGFYSLIHLPREEQVEMLNTIWKWLKPGGYFLANFGDSAMEGLEFDGWLDEKGWVFSSGWGVEGTLEKVKEAGFEILVEDVKEDDVRASFLWVIAKKPQA